MNNESNLNSVSEIKQRAIESVKWSFLMETGLKLIYPIINLIVARILVPADFGILAASTLFVSFAQLFQDFGLGQALVQRENDVKKSANVVFWSNVFLSVIFYTIIFFIAPLAADFFNEPTITKVLRVLSLQIIFVALGSVHFSLLRRNFQFKQIFFSGLGFTVIPGIISISLALLGYGIWALVFGSLSGSILQTVFLWKFSQWRPEFMFDFALAKQLFGFGKWIIIEMFFSWIIVNGEIIVIGRFLGIQELGIYKLAFLIVSLVFGSLFNPIQSVLYSSFARLKSNITELKKSFLYLVKIIEFLALPLGVGLALTAWPIVSVILGPKWQGTAIIIFLLSFFQMISWTVGINNNLYKAIGRPDISSKITGYCVFFYLPVYVLSAPYGLVVFCIARIFLEVAYMVIQVLFTKKVFNINYFYLFKEGKTAILATAFMGAIVYCSLLFIGPFLGYIGLVKLLLLILVGVFSYFAAFLLLEKVFLIQLFSFFKRSLQ